MQGSPRLPPHRTPGVPYAIQASARVGAVRVGWLGGKLGVVGGGACRGEITGLPGCAEEEGGTPRARGE